MPTLELTLAVPDALREQAIAHLDANGATGFLEDDGGLRAYVPEGPEVDALVEAARGWLDAHGLPADVAVREIADENWNAAYEATLGPIVVPPFLVRPSWAEVPPDVDGLIEIVIDPKMSFGTGYHESTRLVLGLLPRLVQTGDRVLDAGCGTGILAIAALKLGAASALAFDVDTWAEENAAENFARNGVSDRAEVRIGSVEVVPEAGFDVVLANIHREVLLELMPDLSHRVRPDGHLVLAGLLRTDADTMREAVRQAGFTGVAEAEEG
ncbi:MAG TPA: 50S ribosomal protein L11 methyltransferase, partial [Rhodothermales bacterium]|nr:50S ribosomal protein L11 methyltransferase [Rhodothermales bacterium]